MSGIRTSPGAGGYIGTYFAEPIRAIRQPPFQSSPLAEQGRSGDGGPAINATFFVGNVVSDAAGNLYFTDPLSQRIRKIDTSGIITTVAGTGTQGYSGDGGPATSAKLALPQGLTIDSVGNLYFGDNAGFVRKVDTSGIITTVAGNGSPLPFGDGGPATKAGMVPLWVAVDTAGNLYIADTDNQRIRKVTAPTVPALLISTLAGTGTSSAPT